MKGCNATVQPLTIVVFLTIVFGTYARADDAEQCLQQLQLLQRKCMKQRRNFEAKQEQQAQAFLKVADFTKAIGAYEAFLSARYELPDLDKRAISSIYQLTEIADLIEGYEEFLRKYPSASEAESAGERLHEIAYAVAKTEHTIPAYTDFLLNFPAAPKDLQDAACLQSVSLEEKKIERELAGYEFENELERQNIIERIGRRLYEEAIAAKSDGDDVKFRRKYETIMSSEIFTDSEAHFDLRRDQELVKKLDEIQRAIDALRGDIKRANAQLLEKLIWIQKTELHQEKYLQTIQHLIEVQQEKENLPEGWDVDKPLWENVVEQGTEHLGDWVFPRTTEILKILVAVRAQRLLKK